ncbi:MAG: acyltransferase [Chitinophagaceae bacterium]|nr:acyltransferase [Chitinophagaceae bacterium]
MKKLIKGFLLKILVDNFEQKKHPTNCSYNPHKIKIGKQSIIDVEFKIENGEKIFIGNNTYIGKQSWLASYKAGTDFANEIIIKIGDNVTIGNYSCITAIECLEIMNGCLISEYFYISDHTHGYDPAMSLVPVEQPLYSKGKVVVGENCFIGYRVSILPGVTIGRNCVIGAHSVVTKNIPDFCIAIGIPARVIKKYNWETHKWEKV